MSADLELFRTPAADAEFLRVFNRLCVALREVPDDSGTTQRVYFDALKDLPIHSLEEGAGALMKEPGRKWFPTTAEWRTAAEKAQQTAFRAAVQPARENPWVDECGACGDTGWERFYCPGDASCRRTRRHDTHHWVAICACRPNNRTWQRHQHFGSGA